MYLLVYEFLLTVSIWNHLSSKYAKFPEKVKLLYS